MMYNEINQYCKSLSEVDIVKKILTVIISLFLLTSCGAEYVAKIGSIKMTTGEYEFYLDSIKTQMQGTELKTDTDWENQEIEGKKAIDVAKERAMDIGIKNALYIEAGKAHGMTLGVEEKMTIDRMKSQIMNGYGSGEEYNKYLEENNITDKFMNMMLESSAYQNKIYTMISEETPVNEEEMIAYYEENREELETRYRKAKHILILSTEPQTGIPLVKSEQEKAERHAESILKRVRDGEDFDALMHEFSQDPGLSESPEGYVFTSGEMVPEFEACVDSVGYGEISYCESDYGYHIVKRLPVSFEDIKESVEKEIYEKKVDDLIYAWAEEYGVEITKYEEKYKDIK